MSDFAKLRPPMAMIIGLRWALRYADFWDWRYLLLAGLLGFTALAAMHVLMLASGLIVGWRKS